MDLQTTSAGLFRPVGTDGFGDQPKVVNGFSDLMVEVFGEAIGKHARSAVGVAGLPGNAAVEMRGPYSAASRGFVARRLCFSGAS
jgi:hypothetical protein